MTATERLALSKDITSPRDWEAAAAYDREHLEPALSYSELLRAAAVEAIAAYRHDRDDAYLAHNPKRRAAFLKADRKHAMWCIRRLREYRTRNDLQQKAA